MKRILVLLIVLLAACGEQAPSSEAPPVSAAPLLHNPTLYTYTAINNQVVVPQARNTDSACYFRWLQGGGGYAGQPTWPNGTVKNSAEWYFERNLSPTNVVSAQHLDGIGAKIASLECSPFANFDSVNPYQPPPPPAPPLPYIYRYESDGQGPHTVDVKLWDTNSFCYLKDVKGLTHGGTAAYVYTQADASSPTGYYWRLRYQGGSPQIAVAANCVYLGRAYESPSGGILAAYTNQPRNMNTFWGEGICFITGIWGDLNNGSVFLDRNGPFGTDRLSVSGAVWGASAMCVGYFWDQTVQ